MPSWVAGAAGIFAISAASAYLFLRLRCRGVGYPLGPLARRWATVIVLITAIVSTGLSLAAVVVSDHLRAAVVGLIVPSGLWLGRTSAQHRHRRNSLPRTLLATVAVPFQRLEGRMGDDVQLWCDKRSAAALQNPQLMSDAAEHYCLQVANQIKDDRVRHDLNRRRESIEHKIGIVRLVGLDTTPARLQAALQRHPSTRDTRKYAVDDPPLLARRLTSEAENELHLLLAYVYRLGYRKLVIYGGFKPPPAPRKRGGRAGQSTAQPS
jgi:hypothetical protein